eukprot:s4917_g4.t1
MGATDATDKEGSPQGEGSMPDISPNTDDEGELHDQGIWGKCKTVADLEAAKATKDAEAQNEDAFDDLEKSKDKQGLDAEAQNEDAFDDLEKSKDKQGLVDTAEYKEFIMDGYRLERKSPLVLLKDQRDGYGYTGFFHTGIRDIEVDLVGFFKVQHMGWRVAAPPHAYQKFHLSETELFKQVGNLSLDKMPNSQLFRYGRKKTAPSTFSDYIEYDSSGDSRGALIKSIAQSKSHLFTLCEATNVTQGEKDFLYARGWQTIQNNSGDILIGSRTNLVGSSLTRLAGSTLVGEAHAHLPLTYMIVEIIYGKTLPQGGQGNRGEFPDSSYTRLQVNMVVRCTVGDFFDIDTIQSCQSPQVVPVHGVSMYTSVPNICDRGSVRMNIFGLLQALE